MRRRDSGRDPAAAADPRVGKPRELRELRSD